MAVIAKQRRRTRGKPGPGRVMTGSYLTRGLVGAWLLNEGGGSRLVALPNNIVDALLNSASWGTGPLAGPVLSFDGSSSYLDIAAGSLVDNLTTLSMVFWAFIPDVDATYALFDKGLQSSLEGWKIDVNTTNSSIRFIKRFDTVNMVSEGTVSSAEYDFFGKWGQFVVTWDGGQGWTSTKFYFDGREGDYTGDLNDGSGASNDDSDLNLFIGKSHSSTQFFNGLVDHFLLYNRVLSANEVRQLYVDPFAFMSPRTLRWFSSVPESTVTRIFPLYSSLTTYDQLDGATDGSLSVGSSPDSSDLQSSVSVDSGDSVPVIIDTVSSALDDAFGGE